MADLVRIRVRLNQGPAASEMLWAQFMGEQLYRLANCPFYAEGTAEGDIVQCEERNGWPTFRTVVKDSGNGNIRILIAGNAETTSVDAVLGELTTVGCTCERASPRWLAVTVPATMPIPFSQFSDYLNQVDDRVIEGWEVGKWPMGSKTPAAQD